MSSIEALGLADPRLVPDLYADAGVGRHGPDLLGQTGRGFLGRGRVGEIAGQDDRLSDHLAASHLPLELAGGLGRSVGIDNELEGTERLPAGLDTLIGSGNQSLTPAQAQQIALARLIIADPHTLVLDEATSLIDPRTARTLEGSMNALLDGRTVVAIAHRLHTAHDADRIAVVIDGEIVELGSHQELVEQDGEYAALWHAWTS